ncbi:MAG: VOC family protein [Thermoplasmata archaeon]|nr:VOC family protein [Thermoplasmata archaeon]
MAGKQKKVGRVTGIGGVFLRARKPEELATWYRDHLGLEIKDQMVVYKWISPGRGKRIGTTLWAALAAGDREWGRSRPSAAVNYRVANLDRLLVQLRAKGVRVSRDAEASSYGKFAWAEDPEGNRLELWEPPKRYQASDRHVPME